MGRVGTDTGFPPDFVEALQILASASEEVAALGLSGAILVGGAAVEIWTNGRYVSGDFDLVTSDSEPLERALIARGFRREDRNGHLLRGLYHPTLGIGIEFVSGPLFDGRSDRNRLWSFDLGDNKRVVVIPPEDVIADRLGQHAAASGNNRTQLVLAQMVYALAGTIDAAYLLQRANDEIGPGISEAMLRDMLSP